MRARSEIETIVCLAELIAAEVEVPQGGSFGKGLREQRHVRLREAAIRKVETCEGGTLCDCKKHVTIASRDSAPREAQVKEMGGG